MPTSSSTPNRAAFITPEQRLQIEEAILNAAGALEGLEATTPQNRRLTTANSDSTGSNRETIHDGSVILEAVTQVNTEHNADALISLNQKIDIVKAKIQDMRCIHNARPSASQQAKALAPTPKGKNHFQSAKNSQETTPKNALKIIEKHHKNAPPEAVDDIDLDTEAMFVRQFGAAFQSGLNIGATEPEAVLETVIEQTERFLKCYKANTQEKHFLLSYDDIATLKRHQAHLKQLNTLLPILSDDYTKEACHTHATEILEHISALKTGDSYLVPVLKHTDENSSILSVVSFTRTGPEQFSVSLNTPNPQLNDVHPSTVHPHTGKTKYQSTLTYENVPIQSLFQNNESPIIIEALLELSYQQASDTTADALYLVLGHLSGQPKVADTNTSQFHAAPRTMDNHFDTLQRLQQGNNSPENPNAYQRTALALSLHGLETHLLRWQNILVAHPGKCTLLERSLQNLARRGVKLQKTGIIDAHQVAELTHRLDTIKHIIDDAKATHLSQQENARSNWIQQPLTNADPITLSTQSPTLIISSPIENKEITATQVPRNVITRPPVTTITTTETLFSSIADLTAFMNECDVHKQHELQHLVVGDFIRNLPIPSHNTEDFWHLVPQDQICTCTQLLSNLIERYIRNEAHLPVRTPERALVIGKTMVALALLTQRIPELALANRHIDSIDDFLRHEFTDYGYSLTPADSKQFYALVTWAETSKSRATGHGLQLGLPESKHRFGRAQVSVLTAVLDNHIHQPTLRYFADFVTGSSKPKTLKGEPNPDFNPLRYDLKKHLRVGEFFPETTARKRRHLRRDEDVLAFTLMSDIGNNQAEPFFKDDRQALNDLRRLIVFSQISRKTSPKSLLTTDSTGAPEPIRLSLKYHAREQPNRFLRFFFGQCLLADGGSLSLSGTGPLFKDISIAPPNHGQRLHWEAEPHKRLMTGPSGNEKQSLTKTRSNNGAYHYHARSECDNEILLRHHEENTLSTPNRLTVSELNMAKPALTVRKALAYYRDHLSLLEQTDHRKQLFQMLCRNEPFYQTDTSFLRVPDGGTVHHELAVDAENIIDQLTLFLKAGLFRFQAEEKLAPLLFMAQLAHTVKQHVKISCPHLSQGDAIPNGLDTLKSLLFNESVLTTDADRAQIAKMVLILLAQDAPDPVSADQLKLAATALAVANTVSLELPDATTLNDTNFEQARLRLETRLQHAFDHMDHRAQSRFINVVLTEVQTALTPTSLKDLKLPKLSNYWYGEFPNYYNDPLSINISQGEICRDGYPLANRLPSAIRRHRDFNTVFGAAQPIARPLSTKKSTKESTKKSPTKSTPGQSNEATHNTSETNEATRYSIFDDHYRLQLNAGNALDIQQAFSLAAEHTAWFAYQPTYRNETAASIISKLKPLSPDNLLLWQRQDDNKPQTQQSSAPSTHTWLATSYNDVSNPLYEIEHNLQNNALVIQPANNPQEQLVPLPARAEDPVLSTLAHFESAEHIALWQDKSSQKINRLAFERFNIVFERDPNTDELLWSQNKDYRLSSKYRPLIPGFLGALQLQHRQQTEKGLLILPRGTLEFDPLETDSLPDANNENNNVSNSSAESPNQPAVQSHSGNTNAPDLIMEKYAGATTSHFHKTQRIQPYSNPAQSLASKGIFSTNAIPFSGDGTILANTAESKLQMALLKLGTGDYREAVRWISSAKTLKPLTAAEQQAADAILLLNNHNGDWYADAVATRLHLHAFLADNAQGITPLTPLQADYLQEDLTRYANLHNNVNVSLRLTDHMLGRLIQRLDEAKLDQATPPDVTALPTLTENDETAVDAPLETVEQIPAPDKWPTTKAQLLKIINSNSANTIESTVSSTRQSLTIPGITQDDQQLESLFKSFFINRKRPLTRAQLMTFVDKLPLVAPPASEFKSLFKSLLLLVQANGLSAEDKGKLKSRIQLVDPTRNAELTYTRQILLMLLERPHSDFANLTYPRDSWQRPTSSGWSRYSGRYYRDDSADIDNQSADYDGRYSYTDSNYSSSYYGSDTRHGERGSYNHYSSSGAVERISADIDRSTYRDSQARERSSFIATFKQLLPLSSAEAVESTPSTEAKLFTVAETQNTAHLQWPARELSPTAPNFSIGATVANPSVSTQQNHLVLADALRVKSNDIAQSVMTSNSLDSAGKPLDISSLTDGVLIQSRANHAPVLEEQAALYQQHVSHWFGQSNVQHKLGDGVDLDAIQQQLAQWIETTRPQLAADKADLVTFANQHRSPEKHQTRQLATLGQAHTPLSWEMLMIRLGQRNTQALVDSNPSLRGKDISKINARLLSQLTLETTVQQAERALQLTREILTLRGTPSDQQSDPQSNQHRIEQLESDLAAQLNTRRHFNAHKFPEYLVWEAVGGIILRENQVRVLDQLLHRSNADMASDAQRPNSPSHEAVVQLIMGAGKTKALLPLYMALVPKMGNKLPVAMVPKPLLEINAGDLSKGLRTAFGQLGYTFNYNRASSTQKAHVTDIQDRLARTIDQGGFMITSRESIQTLELKLQELLESASAASGTARESFTQQADQLAQYIVDFRSQSDVLIDEIDYGLDTRYEVNYTVGKTVGLMPARLDLVTSIFETLVSNAELPFGEKLALNEQASLHPSAFSASSKELLITEVITQASVFDTHRDALLFDFELIDYLVGKQASPPAIVQTLAAQDDTREIAQLLVLLKEQVNTLLPATLAKSGGEAYGFSTKDPNSLTPGPRDKGKHKEGSNFANPYETLNFLYQLVSDQNFVWRPDQVTQWVNALQAQQLQEVAEAAIDPAHTKAQAVYTKVIANVAPELSQLADLHSRNKASMKRLTETLNADVITRLRLARHLAAPTITQAPRKLSNNPYDLVDASGHVQGFSGTLWNATTFPQRLSPSLVAETDGKVTKILVDTEKTDITVLNSRAPAEILAELASNQALRSDTRAFIDAGAVFRGLPGAEVADALLTHFQETQPGIKGVLYFDQQDRLIMRFQDGREQVLPNTDPETLANTGLNASERFTYYDQPRTVGTDIAQGATAHALVTLGLNTTKRDWFQGVLRMRQPKTQSFTIVVPSVVLEKINTTTPTMSDLIGHSISNESARLALDKFRAATQQLKNGVLRALKRELLNTSGEARVALYSNLSALMSENLLDDPLNTMATISHIDTKAAIHNYRAALVNRLTRHKTQIESTQLKPIHSQYFGQF